MGRIIVPYKPREVFREYHDSDRRFSLTVAHRRCGKTVARINKLIRKAAECDKLNPRFGYLAPYFVQAKDIAWLYLKHYSGPILELGGKVNESELSVTLPHNNAIIRLYGAENAERMRGIYFDGIVIDEAQGIAKTVLSTIIMPALADRMGWLDVAGTPRGWQNMLGELYKLAKENPEWFVQMLRASETGILPEDELARQRQLLSENEYEQEFECSFDAAIVGAVYGKWIADADKAGRITDRVQHDDGFPVYTAWDLGFGDATAIWFYQIGVGEILVIDYYECSGEGIKHYCDMLKDKPYRYHTHYVPHDANAKQQAAEGRTIVEQAATHGVKMHVIPAVSQANAIEALRVTLPKCWFNETNCHNGLEALRNYHFEFDDNLKIFRTTPKHDWSSHACDAAELMARMWKDKVITTKQMDIKAIETKFHRLRREHNMDKLDPYRIKPMRGKK